MRTLIQKEFIVDNRMLMSPAEFASSRLNNRTAYKEALGEVAAARAMPAEHLGRTKSSRDLE